MIKKRPEDFKMTLRVHADKVELNRFLPPHLFQLFAPIVETAAENAHGIYSVSSRNGKFWAYDGDQKKMIDYLKTTLPLHRFDQIDVVKWSALVVSPPRHTKAVISAVEEQFCPFDVEKDDADDGYPVDGPGPSAKSSPSCDVEEPLEKSIGSPPKGPSMEHLDAVAKLKNLRGAWEHNLMPRTQAVRKVAQIVRRRDNDLTFADGALDALLGHVEGIIE